MVHEKRGGQCAGAQAMIAWLFPLFYTLTARHGLDRVQVPDYSNYCLSGMVEQVQAGGFRTEVIFPVCCSLSAAAMVRTVRPTVALYFGVSAVVFSIVMVLPGLQRGLLHVLGSSLSWLLELAGVITTLRCAARSGRLLAILALQGLCTLVVGAYLIFDKARCEGGVFLTFEWTLLASISVALYLVCTEDGKHQLRRAVTGGGTLPYSEQTALPPQRGVGRALKLKLIRGLAVTAVASAMMNMIVATWTNNTFAPVRVIHLEGASQDELHRIIHAEFVQDYEPVLVKGGAKHVLPNVTMQWLDEHCGTSGNRFASALGKANEYKRILTAYGALTGRSFQDYCCDDAPRIMHDMARLVREADQSKAYGPYWQYMMDSQIHYALPGFFAKAFSMWEHSCDSLDGAAVKGPIFDAQPSEGTEGHPLIIGAVRTGHTVPLHKHPSWVENRMKAAEQGRLWKKVVTALHGEKHWILYPGEQSQYISTMGLGNAKNVAFNFFPLFPNYVFHPLSLRMSGWAITLKPGDVLLLPSNNLHFVWNQRSTLGLSVSATMPMK